MQAGLGSRITTVQPCLWRLEAVLKAGCRVKNACIIELFMSYS